MITTTQFFIIIATIFIFFIILQFIIDYLEKPIEHLGIENITPTSKKTTSYENLKVYDLEDKYPETKRKAKIRLDLDEQYLESIEERENQKEERRQKKFLRRISKYCSLCHKKFNGATDHFFCRYCNNNFCGNHRLPETHKCKGNPQRPKGRVREIHSRGGIWASGHEEFSGGYYE